MTEPSPSPWKYIPLAAYQAPAWPAAENVRRGFRALWRSMRRVPNTPVSAINPATLSPLSAKFREALACRQSVQAITQALEAAVPLGPVEEPCSSRVTVLVSAFHCATRDALLAWAHSRQWGVIEPPAPEQILEGGEAWMAELSKLSNADCILPRLERCFLRHADGLDLLRRLLDWLMTRRGRSVVLCNSWAWAFLCAALSADAILPAPWTLAPLGEAELHHWFAGLLAESSLANVSVRNAATGRLILSSGALEAGEDGAAEKRDDFLTHLAAGSRGIGSVAWGIWKQNLRHSYAPGTQPAALEKAEADPNPVFWIKPWSELDLPVPPPKTRQGHRFIFHALLLHGGLTEAVLCQIMPLPATVLRQSLRVLEQGGLIELENGAWQIAPAAYPAVRQALVNEEYLVDAL